MKYDFFTLGGKYLWEDILYYQNWRIQRKVKTNRYRLLDSCNIRRESGTFELCKDTLLKYISACELDEPKRDIVILIHGFARTQNSLKNLQTVIQKKNIDALTFNYCSLSSDLKSNAKLLLNFIRNFTNYPHIYFVTVGAGCLVLRKMFDICDNYRILNIKGVISINPLNSGSDFAFVLNRFSWIRKLFGPMLADITPDETMKITKFPQDIPLYLIFSPSKISSLANGIFSRLESFPQLSPPSEASYSQNTKHIQTLSLFPLNNENMHTVCVETLEDLIQNNN